MKNCVEKIANNEAFKYTLGIREEPEKTIQKLQTIKRNVADQSTVKDCLRPKESTPFQLLMAELKNTIMDSYWNKEVGKTRYQMPNLPAGMDPIKITFGKPSERDGTAAETINPSTDFNSDIEKNSSEHRIYIKSQNAYYPSEQINREYEAPFDKFHRFGKPSGGNWEGKRIKKLMHWLNSEPVSKVSCLQADFYSHTQPRIGEVKNAKAASLSVNCTFEKRTDKKALGVSETLKESLPINTQLPIIMKSLENINKLRFILKKREILFSEVQKELNNFDEENSKSVHINELFDVLKKFRIFPEKESFSELLKILKFAEEDRVNYQKAINLLNWKCDFPELPKFEVLDSNCYATIYSSTIGSIRANEYSAKDLRIELHGNKHQSAASALIAPNIFTQYGFTDDDLLKPHSKEVIFSILKKLDDFPEEKFDSIWEEGLKIDRTEGVCILTIKTLLDKFIAEMGTI